MAKYIRVSEKHHALTGLTDRDEGEFTLVKGRKHAYLWIGGGGLSATVFTISGQNVLRKLAHAILKEIPATKKKKK